MPIGRLSIRSRPGNHLHHLYRNNGDVWWVHYTLNWDGRTRRVRRSLGTKDVAQAVRVRDELFARIDAVGEPVPERRVASRMPLPHTATYEPAGRRAFASHPPVTTSGRTDNRPGGGPRHEHIGLDSGRRAVGLREGRHDRRGPVGGDERHRAAPEAAARHPTPDDTREHPGRGDQQVELTTRHLVVA